MSSRGALVLALLPGLILVGCSSKMPPEPLWAGHLAPLSGPGKTEGTRELSAVRMAVDEASALRIGGRPLAVRHVDTRDDPETARGEAVRLITVSKVTALIVGGDAVTAERVGRESLPYGLPVLVCGELASPPGENVFVVGAGPEPRGRALARYAGDTIKPGTVAVVVDGRNALAGVLASAFVQQCRKQPAPAIQESAFLNDQELKERVTRLVKSAPSAVLVAGSVRDCLTVRADLREARVAVPVLFGGADVDPSSLYLDDKEGPDVYLATAFAEERLSEKGRDFERRFRESTGEQPTVAAALAYDATRLLFEAMRQAGTANPARVRDQLSKTDDFESVTGSLAFRERQARRPVFVVRVRDSEAKVVRTGGPDD
jgi:branched-chain amino acid transport system substrate-binding protein